MLFMFSISENYKNRKYNKLQLTFQEFHLLDTIDRGVSVSNESN